MIWTSRMNASVGRRLVLLGLALATMFSPSALAQEQPEEAPGLSAAELLADMLVRTAIVTLASQGDSGEVRPDQLTRGEVLLDLALQLTPQDAELWRYRAGLAEQVGDDAAQLNALSQYIQLTPEDDAAQLKLFMLQLAEVETLDGRLALLEEMIGRRGTQQLSAPLRSRLASSAAVAAQEMGDDKAFLKNLKIAVSTDESNGEAAALTYELATQRGADPVKLAAAAVNLVRALPLDPVARVRLGESLANLACYERAAQQFSVAAQLSPNQPLADEAYTTWLRCLIAAGQKQNATELLSELTQYYTADDAQGQAGPGLPVEMLMLRRVLEGDSPAGTEAYNEAVAKLQAAADAGDGDARLELAWIEALFGPDTERVAELLRDQPADDARYVRAQGFLYMREGAERWARPAFEKVAAQDAIADYGLALLKGKDDAGRARFLGGVVRQGAGSFGAVLAANELNQLKREVPRTPGGDAVARLMDKLPGGLWRFDTDRNPWVGVRVEYASTRSRYLEPIIANITLHNAMPIPLSISEQEGIGPTTFASIAAYTGGQPIGEIPFVVLDLGRRITLQPGERITFPVRIDRSIFGAILTRQAPSTLTYNSTFIVGPRIDAQGGMSTGPLGGLDTVRSTQAFVPLLNPQNVESWVAGAASANDLDRFTSLGRLGLAGEQLVPPTVEASLSRAAIAALRDAYEKENAIDQAWTLLMLNADTNGRSSFQAVLDQAQRSDDPLVRIAYLISQVDAAESRPLATAIRDGGPVIKRFATALKESFSAPAAGDVSP